MALLRSDVSEELSAYFIRVKRIGELETTLAVTSNRCTLQGIHPDEGGAKFLQNSVLTRATWHNIPEDTICHIKLLIYFISKDFRPTLLVMV
jgi:hypothetical protein